MESSNDQDNNIRNDKRKLPNEENEADIYKKVHLDPDLNVAAESEPSSSVSQEDTILAPLNSLTNMKSSENSNEKETSPDISQISELDIMQDVEIKSSEVDICSKHSKFDEDLKVNEVKIASDISKCDTLETKETSTLPTNISSIIPLEHSPEASSSLAGNEETSNIVSQSPPLHPITVADGEKLHQNFCVSEVENIEQSNIEDTTSSEINDDKNKPYSIKPDQENDTPPLIKSLVISQESDSSLDKKIDENYTDKENKIKEPPLEDESVNTSLVLTDCKESPSFEGTLKNLSVSNIVESNVNDDGDKKCIVPTVAKPPLNTETTFVPIPQGESSAALCNELEAELDKKSEISAMEVESNNHTPIEGSLVETPCDSGETSPSTSTPADSCQVSAAPSPLLKEDPAISESLLDDSSMDTKDIPDENEEDKELESVRPVRFGRRRKRTIAQKYKKGKRKLTPMLVDEETRMSATGTPELGLDEDSQSSVGTSSKKESRRYKSEVIVPESTETFTADKVFEYVWPLEGLGGELYFIQEHVSQYLGISSFKRRYPDLKRRVIESQEKEYLKDLGLVTEIACDLGLTAVRSEDMLDIMFSDFPSKYEELQRVLREKKEKQLKEKGKVEYQVVNLDKSKMKEYSRKAALNASKWNVVFNRERHEERRYSFDLQTFCLHMPISRGVKLPSLATKLGSYPVAVLPGQYTDYCKIYSSNELKGMPLQTVLAGPFTAEELAADLQDDSDDDAASAVASVGTCPEFKEESETTLPVDPLSAEKQPRCKVCNGGRGRNKDGKPEPLIICGTCRTPSHPTCIDLTLAMITKIESYSWQCMDCKTCAQCNDPDDEERMIFCDMCDRGYHIYCVGLRKVPNGRWHCKECAVCNTCGSRNPAGNEHIKNAEWQHEFKKDKDNKQLKYACTLCMPCDKYWKRRQFCSVCMKVYRSIPEDGMVRCMGCPKYVHKDGCSILQDNERFCNYCYRSRNSTALTHSRIIAAAKKKMATGSPMWK